MRTSGAVTLQVCRIPDYDYRKLRHSMPVRVPRTKGDVPMRSRQQASLTASLACSTSMAYVHSCSACRFGGESKQEM